MEDKVVIDILKELRNEFLQRVGECGHNSICNIILQLHEDINAIEKKIERISPSDCDW